LHYIRERYSDIPFIFISGTMGEDAAIQALTEGATDYVLKQKLSRLAPAVLRALRDAENRAERRRAEETLRESEERFRAVANSANDGIISTNSQGIMFYWNKTAHAMFGYTDDEILGQSLIMLMPERYQEKYQDVLKHWFTNYENRQLSKTVEAVGRRKDGSEFPIELSVGSWNTREGTFFTGIVRDITERKHHELEREAIISVSKALRQATTRTEILTVILDQLVELFEADGSMLGLPNQIVGGITVEMGRGVVGERFTGLNIPQGEGVSGWVISNKKPYLNNNADIDSLFYHSDLLGDSHCVASVPLIAQERAIGVLWIARKNDITEQDARLLNAIADIAANAIHRVTLYERTEQQLHHLIALHQIDIAISTNFDISVILNVILNNVRDELEVDAASILLLDPVTHTLDYAAGIGYRARGIEQSHVKLGDGYAGTAALEYRTVSCPDLRVARGTFSRSSLLADEGFVSHYATPLLAKGQVKGVLEIFHRKTLELESEWISYFETLATQSAIAIESASLFENLQRSNIELTLAYDATIEGWSRALDLRDRETEGHTQRVTEMVLKLAEKMGMSDAKK
ncbi:MAG TPA: PAS domain S-box protein, partial [Anaerolineales bacterium]